NAVGGKVFWKPAGRPSPFHAFHLLQGVWQKRSLGRYSPCVLRLVEGRHAGSRSGFGKGGGGKEVGPAGSYGYRFGNGLCLYRRDAFFCRCSGGGKGQSGRIAHRQPGAYG